MKTNYWYYSEFLSKIPLSKFVSLKQIVLRVYLSDTDSKSLMDVVLLFIFLTGEVPYVREVNTKGKKSFVCYLILTRESMFKFLEYFSVCRYNFITTRKFDLSREVVFMLRNFFFTVEDMSFWLNVPEELFCVKSPVTIEFLFSGNFNNDFAAKYFFFLLNVPCLDKRASSGSKEDIEVLNYEAFSGS